MEKQLKNFKKLKGIDENFISDIIVAKRKLGRYYFLNAMTGKTSQSLNDVVRESNRYILIDEINKNNKPVTGLYIIYNNVINALTIFTAELKNHGNTYFWEEKTRAFIKGEDFAFYGPCFDFICDVDMRGQAKIDKDHPLLKLGPWFSYDISNNEADGSKSAYNNYFNHNHKIYYAFRILNPVSDEFIGIKQQINIVCGNKNLFGIYNYNTSKEDKEFLSISKKAYDAMLSYAKKEEDYIKKARNTCTPVIEDFPLSYLQRVGDEFVLRYFYKEYDNLSNDTDIRLIEYKRVVLNNNAPECFLMATKQSFWNIICYIDGSFEGTSIEELEPLLRKYVACINGFSSIPQKGSGKDIYDNLADIVRRTVGFSPFQIMYIVLCLLKFPLLMEIYIRYCKYKIDDRKDKRYFWVNENDKQLYNQFSDYFLCHMSNTAYADLAKLNKDVQCNTEAEFQEYIKDACMAILPATYYSHYERYFKEYVDY